MSLAWRAGNWRALGARALFDAARAALEEDADARRSARGQRALGPYTAYFKGSPLRPRPAVRHALRRALGLEIPRLQEFHNLHWLLAHGFLAARPLLAGVLTHAGLPRYQFLFTEFVPDAPTLSEQFHRAAGELRRALLVSLARDVARLHQLGFVHRDLFPRNLLACASPAGPRCAFLDAWRGGPGPSLRGADHDLGCLFLDGAELFTAEEQALFLSTYGEESARAGRALPASWPKRVERAREGVFRREARRRPGLASSWEFPGAHLKPSPPSSD